MKSKILSVAAVVLAAMLAQSLAAGSGGKAADDPNAKDQASWQRDLLAWRAQRATNLQAPEAGFPWSPRWLQEGDNTFGSAEDSRVQIAGKAPAHIAVVHLEKGALRLLPPVGGFPKDLLLDGQPAKEQVLFADDADKPSKLTIGTITVIVIHRDDRFALRVKDLQAPTRTAFHGLRWYEPNPAYRVHARWIPYNPPKTLDIPTVLGTTHTCRPRRGRIHDRRKSGPAGAVLEDPKATDLFFILRDATSKTQPMARDVSSTPIFPTMA